jgi:flagellar hook-basal body complex protein FliE
MALISPIERFNQMLADRPQGGHRLQAPRFQEGGPVAESAGGSFGETLRELVQSVNQQQLRSEELAARFAAGQVEHVHDAMLAMEKASLSFQFIVEVRNRLVEGYQELMRMQV